MRGKMRKTGISILGDVPWGTHICQFYQTKQDLTDILVPYFKAGLENNEFCMWVTSEPLNQKEVKRAMRMAMPNFDRYLKRGQIKIVAHEEWYLKEGNFNLQRVLNAWVDKLDRAMAQGYDGIRVTGNTAWLEKGDWKSFADYEEVVNNVIGKYKMLAICSYSLDKCGASEVIDVAYNHQFALIRREGKWGIVESSEHKQAEEVLREGEKQYRSLFDNMFKGFAYCKIIVDENNKPVDFVYIEVNDTFEALTGLKKELITGKRVTKVMPGIKKAHPELFKIYGKVALTGKATNFDIYFEPLKIWLSISVYCPKKGYFVAIFDNITERKKAEEEKERLQAQLIQSEKMAGIGTLASGIAHEFNNLLQIMRGHTESAQRTQKGGDMEDALDIILNTSDRVSKIIENLLTFSRKEASEKEPCDITEPIESVLSLTEEQLKKHNIEVVRKYKRIPQIEVNKGEMQQVFLNMITNARDAMLPGGGKLEIRVERVNKNVKVGISDTGKGIERENLDKIFEPFYTTKETVGRDSNHRGTGLGLSVSYGIVKRHGGAINVESEVGEGTTFTVKFPVKGGGAEKRSGEGGGDREIRKPEPLNILVVDDEEDICKLLTKWLSSEGHRVKSALNGKRAIKLVEKDDYDVVFLDIVMPGIPADEALERIKKISPKTKVVMMTGKLMDKNLLQELRQKGVSVFLQKPFRIEDIVESIKSKG